FHYETQPNPNVFSWYLHQLPAWFHRLEVLFNHLVELVAPWFYFGPRRARLVAGGLTVLFQALLIVSGNVAFLSLNPVLNILSPGQEMNTSFDPFDLVNTYGAFGSIGRERFEIVLEGTSAESPDASAEWREYEFVCKPGDPQRRPCWISPYHHRLDWQMWFAAMPGAGTEPFLVHLVAKLLEDDEGARGLLARDPFGEAPPRFVRARYYRYRFTRPGDPSGAWWTRELVGEYLPPLSREDPRLEEYLRAQGWR